MLDQPLSFRPYAPSADEPNVVVDGTPNAGTTLTLSHWPGAPLPAPEVAADLSAQMAFRYLEHPEVLHGAATVVTANHFDQDGLVSVWAMTSPADASALRPLAEDLAAAGDFATYRDRRAARASMVVSAFADPDRSPVPTRGDDRLAELFVDALGRLPQLLLDQDPYATLWEEEDAHLSASEAALADGRISIDEHADVDLAVVDAPAAPWWGHRFGGRRYDGVHPMALHGATDRGVILLSTGDTHRVTYRYESWVQLRSRRVRPRIDLGPVAEELSDLDDAPWRADPPGELTPQLEPVAGASALSRASVLEVLVRHLRDDPVAFDPYAPPS
ncbi:DUF6687 family protein [Actinomarinicola tropica]|uniref:Uncharacterized protein n=1 Tax=Actinomarinicola tropica TaxID=2789776 RepID=A0A5Q2RND4_9ACTN|nr:DUF6687 family protein [Actinomarinicola tropica]QGG95926.1 hypothetical protein GH723_12920 [Actinomarinicola tropica]